MHLVAGQRFSAWHKSFLTVSDRDTTLNHVLRCIYDGSPVDAESALNPLISGAWSAGFYSARVSPIRCIVNTHNREIKTPTAITIIIRSRTTSPFRPRCRRSNTFLDRDTKAWRFPSTHFIYEWLCGWFLHGTLGPNQLPLNRSNSPGIAVVL